MSTKQQEAAQEEARRAEQQTQSQERQALEAVVRENVMRELGRPANLHRVQVRQLWGDNYRVNVFVGLDAAASLVAHSYFVAADGTGKVLTATPAIRKRY
jgi:predicted NBD/HSP70 family sugar kinase